VGKKKRLRGRLGTKQVGSPDIGQNSRRRFVLGYWENVGYLPLWSHPDVIVIHDPKAPFHDVALSMDDIAHALSLFSLTATA